jgi:hypothetical protein
MIEIECSDRNETSKKNFRDFVDGVIPFFRALEHEDCVARAIGCIGRLVNVIDEDQPLPGLCVTHFDTVREVGVYLEVLTGTLDSTKLPVASG